MVNPSADMKSSIWLKRFHDLEEEMRQAGLSRLDLLKEIHRLRAEMESRKVEARGPAGSQRAETDGTDARYP